MNKYRIFETEEFLKKIEKLDPPDKTSIKNKLTAYIYPQIKMEPYFGKNIKKLNSYVPGTCRYRIGKFRIFYTIDQEEGIMYILTIDHRKDAYR